MEQKIVEILYKYAEKLTTQGIIKDTDTWLWEGEFSKVAEDIVKLLATTAVSKCVSLEGRELLLAYNWFLMNKHNILYWFDQRDADEFLSQQ